jgi:hypothetical protein
LPDPVIDLGIPGPASGLRPPELRRRVVRAWWAYHRRRVRAGLAGALVPVLLAGGVAPAPARVSIPLPPAGNGQFEVVGDLLFVVESRTRWGAYDLATGQRRWSLERTGRASVGLAVSGGVLVDQRYGFGRALDPRTGAVRWAGRQDRGESVSWSTFRAAPAAGTGVVAGYHWSTPDGLAHRLTGVDLATGAVRWQLLPPVAVQVELTGEPPRLVSIAADGRVELRAPQSGRLLAGRRVPGMAGRAAVPAGVQVVIAGGRLVLATHDPDGLVLRGYAADTLTPRWRRTLPAAPGGARWRPVGRCGPMLCVGPLGTVIDPRTGRVAWTARTGRGRLDPAGDRLLAFDRLGNLQALLDARTGRVVRELSGWRAAVPAGAAPDRLLLTRPATGAGTQVARLDPASRELSELGLFPGRPELCRPYAAGLVCRQHGRLWLWPVEAGG